MIDLGAGVGAVGLAIAALAAPAQVTLVERDEHAFALLERNARPFPCASVLRSDVRHAGVPRGDVVVANPPFTPASEGPSAIESRRAAARSGVLDPFLAATARLLEPDGAGFFIVPGSALPRLLDGCERQGLHVTALRFVHPSSNRPARAVLATLRSTRQPLAVESPWVEWAAPGVADAALAAFLRGPPIRSV